MHPAYKLPWQAGQRGGAAGLVHRKSSYRARREGHGERGGWPWRHARHLRRIPQRVPQWPKCLCTHMCAQVLDISVFAQYSDDDENDFDGHAHSHGQPPAHSKAHGQQPDRSHAGGGSSSSSKQQHHPASSPSASSRTASSRTSSHAQPPAPGHSSFSTHAPSHPASTTTANQSALPSAASGGVLDSSDAFHTWRSNVEGVLAELTASIAAKAPTATLCGHTAKLLALVEEARRREHSSRWLNSGSAAFREAGPGGAALSMREAVSEHVFRLMDSSNSELLMKVGTAGVVDKGPLRPGRVQLTRQRAEGRGSQAERETRVLNVQQSSVLPVRWGWNGQVDM